MDKKILCNKRYYSFARLGHTRATRREVNRVVYIRKDYLNICATRSETRESHDTTQTCFLPRHKINATSLACVQRCARERAEKTILRLAHSPRGHIILCSLIKRLVFFFFAKNLGCKKKYSQARD